MNHNNWGTTLLGAILLLLLAGGLYTWHSLREKEREDRVAEIERDAAKKKADAERDLRNFAETHLTELQKLVDEINAEVEVRERKLALLADEMRRVHVSPTSDKDYKAWSEAVSRLKVKVNELLRVRNDTYLALKKFELNPEGTAELDKQREERLKLARNQAEQTRTQFNEMRNANSPPEPASFVPKEPEKDKGKAPPKKRWWWIF
jgi:hypothetical protein